jgi:hypothetical protein
MTSEVSERQTLSKAKSDRTLDKPTPSSLKGKCVIKTVVRCDCTLDARDIEEVEKEVGGELVAS